MMARPQAFAGGVEFSVPLASMAGCELKSELLLLLTMKFTACHDSSAGPAEIAVAHPVLYAPAPSTTAVGTAPWRELGSSLTVVTAMMNVCSAVVSTPPLAVPP